MARRQEVVVITDEGRDKGKTFIIKEMPSEQGERWGFLATMLIIKAALGKPELANNAGMMAVWMAGAEAAQDPIKSLEFAHVLMDPQLDGWKSCVTYQHAPGHPPQPILDGEACQIEERRTWTKLRLAVFKMHTDFFSLVDGPTSAPPSEPKPTGPSPTRMSRGPLGRSPRRGSPPGPTSPPSSG